MERNNPNVERFLHFISQLESSGGKNLEHKPIKSGMHSGDAAEGQYGVLPNTMEELDRRFPASFNETSTPDDYAKQLANLVLNRADNDETLAAGMWKFGQNTPSSEYEGIRNKDYAQAYDKMRQSIPYSLDPNPYNVEKQQNRFLNLKNIIK